MKCFNKGIEVIVKFCFAQDKNNGYLALGGEAIQ